MVLFDILINQASQKSSSFSDWINLADVVITTSLGIWIAVSVQKNHTNNRAVKDYFIQECHELKDKYAEFLNSLLKDSNTSKSTIEWFKVMTIRINNFEAFIQDEFQCKPEISTVHNDIKQFVTDVEEFNECFNCKNLKLNSTTKRKILEDHKLLIKEMTKTVIDLNKANKKHWKKHSKKNSDRL